MSFRVKRGISSKRQDFSTDPEVFFGKRVKENTLGIGSGIAERDALGAGVLFENFHYFS